MGGMRPGWASDKDFLCDDCSGSEERGVGWSYGGMSKGTALSSNWEVLKIICAYSGVPKIKSLEI